MPLSSPVCLTFPVTGARLVTFVRHEARARVRVDWAVRFHFLARSGVGRRIGSGSFADAQTYLITNFQFRPIPREMDILGLGTTRGHAAEITSNFNTISTGFGALRCLPQFAHGRKVSTENRQIFSAGGGNVLSVNDEIKNDHDET
jgi:hypothetical protein